MLSLSEGLPVVGVKALASGLAFIVSDIGSFRDLVDDGVNGYLCDPLNYDVFSGKLMKLLSNDNVLSKFREKSRLKSRSFDIHSIVLKYEQVLLETTFNENKKLQY